MNKAAVDTGVPVFMEANAHVNNGVFGRLWCCVHTRSRLSELRTGALWLATLSHLLELLVSLEGGEVSLGRGHTPGRRKMRAKEGRTS